MKTISIDDLYEKLRVCLINQGHPAPDSVAAPLTNRAFDQANARVNEVMGNDVMYCNLPVSLSKI